MTGDPCVPDIPDDGIAGNGGLRETADTTDTTDTNRYKRYNRYRPIQAIQTDTSRYNRYRPIQTDTSRYRAYARSMTVMPAPPKRTSSSRKEATLGLAFSCWRMRVLRMPWPVPWRMRRREALNCTASSRK